ncbi:MAG TPA: hypothetical protein VIB39_18835, partial [Candidatus Angelobacter sp.]
MTKEEVKTAILACANRLGHTPSAKEIFKHGGVNRRELRRYFGTYRRALEECGLEGSGCGRRLDVEELFRDWARVAREVKKVPTICEYEEMSEYSVRPLLKRFGGWTKIPEGMRLYAKGEGLAEEYSDVMEMIECQAGRQNRGPKTSGSTTTKAIANRPVYGQLLRDCPLLFAPTCEAGVLFLFGALAERLGFLALRIQTGYPDCEAMRVVAENRMQRLRIEIEYESRNFLKHLHEPKGCDL